MFAGAGQLGKPHLLSCLDHDLRPFLCWRSAQLLSVEAQCEKSGPGRHLELGCRAALKVATFHGCHFYVPIYLLSFPFFIPMNY